MTRCCYLTYRVSAMLLCSFVPKTFSSCSLRYRKHFYSPHLGQNGLSYHLDTLQELRSVLLSYKELHAFNRLNTLIYHSDKSRDIRVRRQTLRSSSVTENLTRVSCILCTDSGCGKLVFLVGTLPLYRYPLSETGMRLFMLLTTNCSDCLNT